MNAVRLRQFGPGDEYSRRLLKLLALLWLATMLPACQRQAVQCTAASAQEPVVGIVKDQLERAVSTAVRKDDGARAVSLSKIRAAIAQLVIGIDDIRTSKEDPNSTKRFCTGTLKIRFPGDTLSDADSARANNGLGSVSDLADSNDIERHADSFTAAIEFNVQPTDAGDKVFAETESGNNMFSFAAQVLASGLMNASIADAKHAQQQAADQQAANQNAALGEQRNANLASAKTDNQLAVQTIAAVWKSLAPATRARLLPLQKAWIRKKDADCQVEAASASTDPTDMEVAKLACDTRAEQERTSWLQPYRGETSPVDSVMGQPTPQPTAETDDL